jgi:hypothetical protein
LDVLPGILAPGKRFILVYLKNYKRRRQHYKKYSVYTVAILLGNIFDLQVVELKGNNLQQTNK